MAWEKTFWLKFLSFFFSIISFESKVITFEISINLGSRGHLFKTYRVWNCAVLLPEKLYESYLDLQYNNSFYSFFTHEKKCIKSNVHDILSGLLKFAKKKVKFEQNCSSVLLLWTHSNYYHYFQKSLIFIPFLLITYFALLFHFYTTLLMALKMM